jgi:hypothetical protein
MNDAFFHTWRRPLLSLSILLLAIHSAQAQLRPPPTIKPRQESSRLSQEPGTISLEDLLPRAPTLKIAAECTIYYQADLARPLGIMPANTTVTLVGMSDSAYRIRGRARHGDVAGWVRLSDIIPPDPDFHENLKALYLRHQQVRELIANKEVALGMTAAEVHASLGKPTRTNKKVNAFGREETLEYSVFEMIPQPMFTRDALGRVIQTITYIKQETGTLSILLKDDVVDQIEEKKGTPLSGGRVKIVVPPIILR